MRPVLQSAYVAELAVLDVLDIGLDGSVTLNAGFRQECVDAYDADPSCLETVFQDRILARAVERGFAACLELQELALVAVEVGAADAEAETTDARGHR